jgi:hypothetical protein
MLARRVLKTSTPVFEQGAKAESQKQTRLRMHVSCMHDLPEAVRRTNLQHGD